VSGLFGVLRFDDAPVRAADLARMGSAMAFYGDGGGTWLEPGPAPGIGLGCRLRPVTAEDAFDAQPLVTADRTLVFAGRLDYRGELAADLGIPVQECAALPDSALVLQAHRRWGEACVDRLAGDWAFAVWEPAERRLLVARDHHGNTGLYWHQDAHRLAFASSLKALLALDDVPKRPDLLRLAQLLCAWPGDGLRSAYEGLQPLPPAHRLQVSARGAETRRTWFPEAAEPLQLARDADYVEAFLEVYGAAVDARLRAVRPVGATLSAGLDSGSVVALAAPLLAARGRELEAFTAVPRGEDASPLPDHVLANEWALAHATALQAGVGAHHAVAAAGAGLLESLQRQVDLHDGPGFSGANYPWLLALLEEVRRRGCGVLLTGQQGNGTVSKSGEASLFWPSLLRGEFRDAGRALGEAEPNAWLALKRQVLKPLLLPALQAWRRRRARPWLLETALNGALAKDLELAARMRAAGHDPALLAPAGRADLAILDLGRNGVGAIWHELGAAFGLEVRDPTADRRVIEFCLRVPDLQLRHRGQGRRLLRRALADRLPPEVLAAGRQGRQAADLGLRVLAEKPELEAALAALGRQPLAARTLDLPRMAKVLAEVDPGLTNAAYGDCGCILLRGINVGLFLNRF
jgi:asparagine synthase (glutamine-hydrolysing)